MIHREDILAVLRSNPSVTRPEPAEIADKIMEMVHKERKEQLQEFSKLLASVKKVNP